MTILFAGDLAWPETDSIDYDALKDLCARGRLVANLEGGVVAGPAEQQAVHNRYKFNLYSHPSVLDTLERLNVVACGLANNHISDYVGGIDTSKQMLAERNIALFGTRVQPWCQFHAGSRHYVVFGACSPLPEPRTGGAGDQAMLFDAPAALQLLAVLRKDFPQATLIAFMHWGYELATLPQPADREWARQAIDAGVDLVIGHHPHVVQGVEAYGSGVIAYSLGNLLLPQVEYRGRRLHYKTPAVCEQLMLEQQGDSLIAHWLQYDIAQGKVRLVRSCAAADDAELQRRTPFAGFSDSAYRAWFAAQQKRAAVKRAGPVFWSYRGWGRIDSGLKFAFLRAKSLLRKAAMRSGLHTPYNW
ncbi:CapA family protein [Rugamonas aquatica]|uniref:Capsule synthesis protein CapA domain-containing protein n=1 Tax=Rugamonas aquatica TaxID=2743357 RepID=A0A6A7MZ07_9BURK|nr:CapA family protein [Rugamonas aquatica]MQA38014.1 hypothetical protein [Rugamonas aquatica]